MSLDRRARDSLNDDETHVVERRGRSDVGEHSLDDSITNRIGITPLGGQLTYLLHAEFFVLVIHRFVDAIGIHHSDVANVQGNFDGLVLHPIVDRDR